ncbi:MAG: ATP-grasp domain-containing protein [Cyanobacteria bacterium J06621_11]
MRILYPHNPLTPTQADEPYQAEYEAALADGLACSLFDFDALALGEFLMRGAIAPKEPVLYRGWMLSPSRYQSLVHFIEQQGGVPITSTADCLRCHHLPKWYEDCRELTAETHFFAADTDIVPAAMALGWPNYFVKDYVKSNTGDKGSIAQTAAEIPKILEQLALYRGEIEGGIALRKVEAYQPETEIRYFVANGTAHSATGDIPNLVEAVTHRIKPPFYSVDVVSTTEGKLRLIELGDGQVSGRKNWPVTDFVQILQTFC